MKVSDLVWVSGAVMYKSADVGLIVEEFRPSGLERWSSRNRGKAWRVLMPNGDIRPKLTKYLRLVEEQ